MEGGSYGIRIPVKRGVGTQCTFPLHLDKGTNLHPSSDRCPAVIGGYYEADNRLIEHLNSDRSAGCAGVMDRLLGS